MALQPPVPGLRRFVNDSLDITRVELRVPPGAELAVDDTVAEQLGPRFKDPAAVKARDKKRRALTEPAEPAVAPDAGDVAPEADEA